MIHKEPCCLSKWALYLSQANRYCKFDNMIDKSRTIGYIDDDEELLIQEAERFDWETMSENVRNYNQCLNALLSISELNNNSQSNKSIYYLDESTGE